MPPIRCRSRSGSRSDRSRPRPLDPDVPVLRRDARLHARTRCWRCGARASTICSTAPSGGTSAPPGCSSSTSSTARSRRPSPSRRATTPSASRSISATPSRPSSSGITASATCSRPTFSSGVMMPMGYEYGCRTRMDVVALAPGDWAVGDRQAAASISPASSAAVNAMKAARPALNVEGPQTQDHGAAQSDRRSAPPLGRRRRRRRRTPRSC